MCSLCRQRHTGAHACTRSTLVNNAAGWTCRGSTRDKLTRPFVRDSVGSQTSLASSNHTHVPSRSGQRLLEAAPWDSCGGITHIAEKAGVSVSTAETGKRRGKQGEGKPNRPDTHTHSQARGPGRAEGTGGNRGGLQGTPQHPTQTRAFTHPHFTPGGSRLREGDLCLVIKSCRVVVRIRTQIHHHRLWL